MVSNVSWSLISFMCRCKNLEYDKIGKIDSNNYNFNIEDIIYNWYNKKKHYKYELNSSQDDTAEFSQMVWKRSTNIGIGFAESNTGVISVVINVKIKVTF